MDNTIIIKLAFFKTVVEYLGILAIPVFVLIIVNIIDYVTSLIASKYRKEAMNRLRLFRCVYKKICMWLLITIGVLLDWLVISTGEYIGISLPTHFIISIMIAIWLVTNEIISILENMIDIGVSIPPFLLPYVKNLRKRAEDRGNGGKKNE